MDGGFIDRRLVLAGLTALALGGCSATLPKSTLGSTTRRTASTNDVPPEVTAAYAEIVGEPFPVRASRMELVPQRFWRQDVADPTGEVPGTVVVSTAERYLYHVKSGGIATRYGVGIGAAGFEWAGRAHIAYKREWPRWTPPADMIVRHPELERYRYGMEAGPDNPLGPRALYIHQGNVDTLYRIHGNSDERTIGHAVSSGCVRLLPQDIIHLHGEVRSGAPLVVV